jgi:N-acetylglutamate synthase-like GNAT family acetyltransferase
MLTTRIALPAELDRIREFYRDNGYSQDVLASDIFVVAEEDGDLCGTVRLCEENGFQVLRGMRVSEAMQRKRVGTQMLEAFKSVVGEQVCYCIPFRHLERLYGKIGFSTIEDSDAPQTLRDRCLMYRRDYGHDVIIMVRNPHG